MTRAEDERSIYLDHHATTPTDPRVAEVVLSHMTTRFGNASSTDHVFGDEAKAAVHDAARKVSALVKSDPKDVVFTSGATESANLAIQGVARFFERQTDRPIRIGLMPVEHHAVLETSKKLADSGKAQLRFFEVDEQARLDLDDFREACQEGLDLACVMAANNEVGTIYPLSEAAEIAHQHGSLVFSDATQAVGKIDVDLERSGVDLLAFSSHKMYGPQGVGALVVRQDVQLDPLLYGGRHQRGLRAGTLNVPGIAGFGEACHLRLEEQSDDERRIGRQRDRMQSALLDAHPFAVVNGDLDNRLAGNLHISFVGIPNAAIVARIRSKVAVSTGSACSSGIESPSHVLQAMDLPRERQESALRIGLGKFTTDHDVDTATKLISAAVTDVRALMSSVA